MNVQDSAVVKHGCKAGSVKTHKELDNFTKYSGFQSTAGIDRVLSLLVGMPKIKDINFSLNVCKGFLRKGKTQYWTGGIDFLIFVLN